MQTLDNWPCRETVAFVKFGMFTGLRRSELFKLAWDDVDFERGMVTLRHPKGGKTTTLPICSEAVDVLRALTINSPFVFPDAKGERRTDFNGPWGSVFMGRRERGAKPGGLRGVCAGGGDGGEEEEAK